jgi:hypothetical protein
MRKVTVSRMRERYAQTVLTFRIAYVLKLYKLRSAYQMEVSDQFRFAYALSLGKITELSTAYENMLGPELIWVLRVRDILLQEGGKPPS